MYTETGNFFLIQKLLQSKPNWHSQNKKKTFFVKETYSKKACWLHWKSTRKVVGSGERNFIKNHFFCSSSTFDRRKKHKKASLFFPWKVIPSFSLFQFSGLLKKNHFIFFQQTWKQIFLFIIEINKWRWRYEDQGEWHGWEQQPEEEWFYYFLHVYSQVFSFSVSRALFFSSFTISCFVTCWKLNCESVMEGEKMIFFFTIFLFSSLACESFLFADV